MTDDHEAIELLLPWYVTGELDAQEVRRIDQHLETCSGCRALLTEERKLRREIAALRFEVPQATVLPIAFRARQSLAMRSWQAGRRTVAGLAAHPLRVAAFAAAQAAMLLIVFQFAQTAPPPRAEYRTLGAGEASADANVVVLFRPETREADFRQALVEAKASIVAGPTEANTYLLLVPKSERSEAVARLRGHPSVMLAQPLDAEPDR